MDTYPFEACPPHMMDAFAVSCQFFSKNAAAVRVASVTHEHPGDVVSSGIVTHVARGTLRVDSELFSATSHVVDVWAQPLKPFQLLRAYQ